MKIVLFDYLYNTKEWSISDIQIQGQARLDSWLGPNKVRLDVAQLAEKQFKFTLWRKYGHWYQDPKPYSDCNDHIVDFDAQIFLGRGYQPNSTVDFNEHPGWCIWNPDIETLFLPEMKAVAKNHHGSRIKNIEVDNNLDHIDLVITY